MKRTAHYLPGFNAAKRWLLSLLAVVFSCLCYLNANADHGDVTPEYKLKAALLYKLTKFVEWPITDNQQRNNTFSMCVLGENVFGDALQPLQKRKVRNMPIEVDFYSQSHSIDKPCHLLFVSDSKSAFVKKIINKFEHHSTLTISDIPQFAEQGGMVGFTRGSKKIGFKINLDRAKQAKLSIAAPLLQLATIIEAQDKVGND